MIDFTNPPIPKDITEIKQDLNVGDKVRCYETNIAEGKSFIGYAYITQILDIESNYCWCEANRGDFETGFINYAFYVIKI